MRHVPANARQASVWPVSLLNQPGSLSISDDDLCAWCSHLLYRPGELSLCSLKLPEGHWPSRCDEDSCAQSCPSLLLKNPTEK